jgi:hypothetical protein
VAPANPIPQKAKKSAPWRFAPWVGGAAILCVCVAVAAGGVLFLASNRTPPTLPTVRIEDPRTGDDLIAGDPSVVYAHADDPDGIAGAELWINGQLVAAEVNAAGENPFLISEGWTPTDVGAYLVLVRATDTKGYVGQSASILVNVAEQPPLSPDAVSAVPASEPGGQPVLIPVPTDEPPAAGRAPSGGGTEPAVGIPAPPPEPPGGAAPADPASGGVPIWGPTLCRSLPSLPGCGGAVLPGMLPPNTPRISARYGGDCQIDVQWTDESDNEIGFRLYRIFRGSTTDLVAPTDTAGSYTDHPGQGGTYRYYVTAYNAAGESPPSAPSAEIEIPLSACLAEILRPVTDLELEALTFNVTESLDKAYCYYALVGPPWLRVPGEEGQYLELSGDSWNIAAYAGGANRLHISLPAGVPLTVSGKCYGWRGSELLPLGEFTNTHGEEDWHGTILTGSSGRFTVTYAIQTLTAPPEDVPRFEIDPSIPPPYDLRIGGIFTVPNQNVLWRWLPAAGDTRRLLGFNVFFRFPDEGGAMAANAQYAFSTTYAAPLAYSGPCIVNLNRPAVAGPLFTPTQPDDLVVAKETWYSVQAVVADVDGHTSESRLSDAIKVTPDCPEDVLAITLDSIGYDPNYATESDALTGDGCNAVDAFGSIEISNSDGTYLTAVNWNCPNCGRPDDFRSLDPSLDGAAPAHDTQVGCVDRPPEGTPTWQAEVPLANETLSQTVPLHDPTGFAHYNNIVLVPLSTPAERVGVTWTFYNATAGLGVSQPKWCSAPFGLVMGVVPWPAPAGTSWKDWIDGGGGQRYLTGQGVNDNVCWLNMTFHVLGTR